MISFIHVYNGYSGRSATNMKEFYHVPFLNYHLFASSDNYHHGYTKQYTFGSQVFHLEYSVIYYSLDFLFFSHWWRHCGGFGLAKTGEEIPLREEYEQGDP
jgi:hypothetical protein